VVFWLSTAGLHAPVIPSKEAKGKVIAVPLQTEAIGSNVRINLTLNVIGRRRVIGKLLLDWGGKEGNL